MTTVVPVAVSPLRQRLIEKMEMHRFGRETQRNYIRDVARFAAFLGCAPDTATAEEVRRFQVEQRDLDVPVPTMTASCPRCGSSPRSCWTGRTWRASVPVRRMPPCWAGERAVLSVLLRACLGAIDGAGDGAVRAGTAATVG